MISYRDMTFCTFYHSCKWMDECGRALTPEVQREADKWWRVDLKFKGSATPICMFAELPECYEYDTEQKHMKKLNLEEEVR